MKKWICIALSLALALSMAACGKETKPSSADVVETPPAMEVVPITPETVPPAKEETLQPVVLKCGDSITTDAFEMTFDSVEILPEIKYSIGEFSSMSLHVEDGCQALVATGHFSNNSGKAIHNYDFKCSIKVNDTYEYDRADLYFKSNKSFEVDALNDLDFYLYASIPNKLVDMFESAEFTILFKSDLSLVTTIYNMDGTVTNDADCAYVLRSGLSAPGTAPAPESTAAAESTAAEDAAKEIHLGDTIVANGYEFTLNNVELSYEVKPRNTSSAYTSYPAPDGKVYIHIDGSYFNSSKKDVCIRDLPVATADYDGGYTYEGFAIVDRDDNSFFWVSSYVVCTPLETCHYHCLIECPQLIDDSDAPLYILLPLGDGNVYRYNIR